MTNPLDDFVYKGDFIVDVAYDLINEDLDLVLVDVRTPQEWFDFGYPDLQNNQQRLIKITLDDNFTTNVSLKVANKDTKVLFLCAHGYRSKRAASLMTKIGYNNCYNIIGGINAWKSKGYPCKQDMSF